MPKERSGLYHADLPNWREAFSPGVDYEESGDVDHVSRTVTDRLQREWDEFSADYQSGITDADYKHLMKDYDPWDDELYGYVRTSNSFAINEKLYDPKNAGKSDDQIFTRRDRRGQLRDLQTVQTLDRAINSHTTKADGVYTRFSNPAAIQATFGLSDDQMSALMNARSLTKAQLQKLNSVFAGRTSFNNSYTSTSANRSMNAFSKLTKRHSANMIFEKKLYVPKGTNAFAVKRNAQESEVIFGRKIQTELMRISVASDGHIVLHEMYIGKRKYSKH